MVNTLFLFSQSTRVRRPGFGVKDATESAKAGAEEQEQRRIKQAYQNN